MKVVLLFSLLFSTLSWSQVNTIIFIGDSLTEGYGVKREDSYPYLVEQKLKHDGLQYKVVNAGISGSTSASGPGRLKWQLKNNPTLVFIALGANDGLRGVSLNSTREHLSQMVELCQEKKIKVVLAGVKLPTNYGEIYRQDFEKLYKDVAKKYAIPLLPYMLDGVGGNKELNQVDGVHPNEKGQQKVAENVYKFLRTIL